MQRRNLRQRNYLSTSSGSRMVLSRQRESLEYIAIPRTSLPFYTSNRIVTGKIQKRSRMRLVFVAFRSEYLTRMLDEIRAARIYAYKLLSVAKGLCSFLTMYSCSMTFSQVVPPTNPPIPATPTHTLSLFSHFRPSLRHLPTSQSAF